MYQLKYNTVLYKYLKLYLIYYNAFFFLLKNNLFLVPTHVTRIHVDRLPAVFVVVFKRKLYNFNKVKSKSSADRRITEINLFIFFLSILVRHKTCFTTSYRFYFVQFLERCLINVI